jgi:hypothetical protein
MEDQNTAKRLAKKLIFDEAEFLAKKLNTEAKTKKSNKGYNKILEVYKDTYKEKYGVFPYIDPNKFKAVITKALASVDDYDLLIKLAEFFVREYSTLPFVNKSAYPNPVIGGFSIFIEKIYQAYMRKNNNGAAASEEDSGGMPWKVEF